MGDSVDRPDGANVPQEGGHVQAPRKRPKLTFISPAEWVDLQAAGGVPTKKDADRNLCQRLLDRQSKVRQEEVTHRVLEVGDTKPRRRQRQQKSRRGRPRKRPIDPKRPWIESDDEDDDYAVPLDDESDDDAFLQRLAEEKEREEAEEVKKKQELQRQRRLKREERRSRATGRPGRPRTQITFAHLYANSNDDAQSSSKPSETSDGEQSPSNDYAEVEEVPDFPPPPTVEADNFDECGNDGGANVETTVGSDFPRLNAVISRRRAPALVLPESSKDLTCPPEHLFDAISIYQTLRRYGRLLRLSPFQLEDFLSALVSNENSNLLAAVHIALLNALITEDDVNGTHLCPPDCKDAVSLLLGFLMDRYTWPYILSLYLSSIKRGESAALAALARVGNTATVAASGPIAAVTFSGGADAVVTSSLFYSEDSVIPLDPSYPFVGLSQRLSVLRGLVGLFLATGPVRAELLREGFTAHDDFCRVCRQSGEVLCCDTCPAVFHLTCLTPPLEAVPNCSWHCPLCVAEQKVYGEKKIPKTRGETRIPPLGYDRAGRIYWFMEGRLFIEPIDFAQREPRLPGLLEGVRDEEWERREAEQPTGDEEDEFEVDEEGEMEGGVENVCDPYVAYANEPPVYYYSSLEAIMAVRQRLSTRWESALCAHLDPVIVQMEAMEQKIKQAAIKLEAKESMESEKVDYDEEKVEPEKLEVNIKKEEESGEVLGPAKWPPVLPLPPALTAAQLTALFSNSQSLHQLGDGENGNAETASSSMENAFVLELSGGVLVHNQDGLFENFPLPPDVHIQRLSESRPALVHPSVPGCINFVSSTRWRGWTNTLFHGLFVPNPTAETTDLATVNIALNRPQQHDEREKRRLLVNKFSLSDTTFEGWQWLDAETSAEMIRRAIGEESSEATAEADLINRRADTVGPLRWLHTMKLTLCLIEAQFPAGSLCPVWRLVRKDWLAAVLRANSVGELADLLARLEAAIRPIAFQRTWTSSIGPLQLDRFTAAQREEEKRIRALERSSASFNALPMTLVRTKTIQPIRHTVWKTRGEEYRRLGGDGWQWVSATRRRQDVVEAAFLKRAKLNTDRPARLGLGWGVNPELLANKTLHPSPPEETTVKYGLHPITGVPLCRNISRSTYTIPPEALPDDSGGVINISRCLREDRGGFFPPPARPPSSPEITNRRCGRSNFRLDSLLALREAAALRDQAASDAASADLDQLHDEREALSARVAEIRSRLSKLTSEAQIARTEHARALKARQTAIEETKQLSEQRLNQSYCQSSVPLAPSRRVNETGEGPGRVTSTPSGTSGRRRSVGSRRLQREEYNYDSGESADSDESEATSSSRPPSSTTGSNVLRRSSRRQKTKSVDPDFVVDFGEDDEEEDARVDMDRDDEDFDLRQRGSDDEAADGPVWPRGGRGIPQLDGTGDDGDDDDEDYMVEEEEEEEEEEEDYGVDENTNENGPEGKVDGLASATPLKSGAMATMPIPVQRKAAPTIPPPPGKSLLALAIEGKTPGIVQTRPGNSNCESSCETKTVVGGVGSGPGVTVVPTPIPATPGGQPVRLVRVLRAPAGAPPGTQIIQAVDPPPASTGASSAGNLVIPASTESALQKSLIQLSSGGGVIVTQASTLPAGYRLITPSSLSISASSPASTTACTPLGCTSTTASAVSRPPLNVVHVVSTSPPSASSQGFRPRPLVPQPLRAGQPVSVSATGTPSLISIAPSPVIRAPPIRPLLAPAGRPLLGSSPGLAPSLRPRMVRVVTQPMQLDPSLDQAVAEAAAKLHQVDLEIFNLRKELKRLESQLAELNARVEEKEDLIARCGISTASPYSLNSQANSLLNRLNRATKTAAAASGNHRSKGRRFLVLPSQLPSINPYAWPPDRLFSCNISSTYPDTDKRTPMPVPNLFRLSKTNLQSLILAAGRKEVSGYEAEKKRLASIPWSYPSARPCFAEAWHFRLRQIILEPTVSNCGILNTPSHYGVAMASLATHLRLFWHSLRWDEIVLSAATSEDATLVTDQYYLKQGIPESHGGGYTLRRVVAIKPLDKFWLRANFLVETSVHKPAARKRPAKGNSRGSLGGNGEVTASRRSGRGNKRFADPDYDPAADEGWRVGIPCSSRRRRRPNYNEDQLNEEDGGEEDGQMNEDQGMEDQGYHKRDFKNTEEWVSEEALQLWEIRNFFDRLLLIDSEYPPPMPKLALSGLPAALVEEVSSLTMKKGEMEANPECQGSWIQPARCPSPESLKPPSPKPPSPPPPPPPPPPIVVMEPPKPMMINSPGPLITPSTPVISQPTFRPLIVNSNRPQGMKTPLVTASRQHVPPSVQITPTTGVSVPTSTPYTTPRRTGSTAAPLSPNSEAARARARSLAASHAARISAANRRFRTEKAALDTRVASLVEELANRRRLNIKYIALQVQEEILMAKKAAQREALADPAPPPSPAMPTPRSKAHALERSSALGGRREARSIAKLPNTAAGRKRGIAKQQPLRRYPRTPPTAPATDSDETHYAMVSPYKRTKRGKVESTSKTEALSNVKAEASVPRGRHSSAGGGSSKRHRRERVSSPYSPVAKTTPATTSSRGRPRSKNSKGASKAVYSTTPAAKPRLHIRTPKYLLEEAESEEKAGLRSRRRLNDDDSDNVAKKSIKVEKTRHSGDEKVYCLCKQPYDPSQAYIGCDLCQDWFHFTCVGLESGTSTASLGDSWICPECRRSEDKAKDEVYCLCRTPYDPSRVYIACDQCDEWYHAECVGLEAEAVAKHEGQYICPVCSKRAADGDVKSPRNSARSLKVEEEEATTTTATGTPKTIYAAPLTELTKKAVLELFADLESHKLSWPFMKPLPQPSSHASVSPAKGPTDLANFKAAFERGAYRSLGDVSFAGNCLFSNARLVFDAGSTEFHCVEVLEAFFLRRMKEVRSLSQQTAASS